MPARYLLVFLVILVLFAVMPAPYTIEQTAHASGLSAKYIRRLRSTMPALFERHTERGANNALLFNEEIVEVLKRTRELRGRGRTLRQIREEMMGLAGTGTGTGTEKREKTETDDVWTSDPEEKTEAASGAEPATDFPQSPSQSQSQSPSPSPSQAIPLTAALRRENALLQSQVTLLTGLLERAEARFDRLLPEARETREKREKKENLKSQLLLWLVEGVVVTVFASGFIFLIWLFAQKAFRL